MQRTDSFEKTLMLAKIEGRRRQEDEIVGWHHQLNGRVWASSRRWWRTGSLACHNPWGHKALDTTEWLNNNWLTIEAAYIVRLRNALWSRHLGWFLDDQKKLVLQRSRKIIFQKELVQRPWRRRICVACLEHREYWACLSLSLRLHF